ncbi:MAG: hypothetical protein R6V34_08040 [Bacteroidales bacterium]
MQQTYSDNVLLYRQLVDKEGKRLFVLSMSRLVVFIVGLALLFLLWGVSPVPALASFLVAVIIFIFLLKKYNRHEYSKTFYSKLLQVNENELSGLNNRHDCFDGGNEFINPHHDFSHDTDLFGDDSLFRYLNRTCTDKGKNILAGWLMDPLSLSGKMYERQEAVRELAGKLQWRQEFQAYGMMGKTGEDEIEDFNSWLDEDPSYINNTAKTVISVLMPSLALLTLALSIAGIIHYSFFIMAFLVNLFIISLRLREINKIHAQVTGMHSMLKNLRQLIVHFEEHSFNAVYIKEMQKALTDEEEKATPSIRKLSKIIQAFDYRLNMLMAAPLNGLLLWDIQCIRRLEKWKLGASELLPGWFDNLGRVDAMCSLANYARNNEGFCYPEISESSHYLSALSMGHPLIPLRARVTNDFKVGSGGEIIIITGANMAGKSTFLRTVAVNMVMAMAGAPVCADKFIFTPCKVFTSMRTNDSLSDKESYFYAELKRLRVLKERIQDGENIFFLLDEILKGTNSKDKSEGARLFTERLVEYKATGMIATHDVQLGGLAENYRQIKNKCFEIEIEGDDVKFDYILREGMTTKMNAAILMKQMKII